MIRRYKPRNVLFFDWSPNFAYAIGLITTDGCLSSDNRHITFVSKDIEQIGHMKMIFKIKSSIGYTRNKVSEVYRLHESNTQLYDGLLSIGLTPHKSLTLGSLEIPEEYFIDFLRGHLDGDGCITTYTDRYNTYKKSAYVYRRIFTTFRSASKQHLEWLHQNIIKVTGIRGAFHTTKIPVGQQNPMHIIKFAKKDSLKLLSKIYYSENLPCLSRKKQVYTNFLKQLSLRQ